MDSRKGLPAEAVLDFPSMKCVIKSEIGRGSNAIVYKGWYADALNASQRHHVLIKELFPYHPLGAIYRDVQSGSILCRPDAQDVMEVHRRSFTWGNEAHLRLRQEAPADIGVNFNTFSLNRTYYTVLDFSGGRTLLSEIEAKTTVSLRRIARRILGVLEKLAIFHSSGLLHLDISPDNILLIHSDKRERVELIDFNSVVSIRELNHASGIRLSVKEGYASPEVRAQAFSSMGAWTDLYAVTAVFFHCLMGRPLSPMEYGGVRKVDVSASPLLAGAPETVKSMTAQMVARGLVAPKRRYRSADEMQADVQELIDRIDGVGITHWALWETGRYGIQREICANPALSHLLDEEALYPLELDAPPGSGMDALLQGQCNAVLTGDGGMGKTTLLMLTAHRQSRTYRRDAPAVAYIPLYSYGEGDDAFIHDALLRRMRFKPETDSYAGARHALDLLLQRPLTSRGGERPVLCLLLDGYNEITADTQRLRQEILQLAGMEGVAIVISSRTELPEYGFETWALRPLADATVEGVLKKNGLLTPQAPQIRELLRTALMLRLYVQACLDSHEQIAIHTREELIGAYLEALQCKEDQASPEGSPRRWQTEAAIRCVYPLIADMEARKGQSVASGELLEMMNALYAALGKRALNRRFPAWVGHAADIRGDAQDGEAWYGRMIHDLLWRRLGLLYQDADGAYRMAHQEFLDALAGRGRELRAILLRRRRRGVAGVLAACVIVLAYCVALWPDQGQAPAYDAQSALNALESVQLTYSGLDAQLQAMLGLLQNPDPQEGAVGADGIQLYGFEDARQALQNSISLTFMDVDGDGAIANELNARAAPLQEQGERFPWNDMAFQMPYFQEMTALFDERQQTYAMYIDVLETLWAAGEDEATCQGVRKALLRVVESDARIAAAYYHLLYEMSVCGMAEWESTAQGGDYAGTYQRMENGRRYVRKTSAFALDAWDDMDVGQMISALTEAKDARYDARMALSGNAAYVIYLDLVQKEG